MHPELAIGAFLASSLVLVPLPWHWRARNIATLSMIAWLFVANLTYAINSIIWADNLNVVVPVWCDIVTKLEIGTTAALPACCLSLAIQLWRVSHAASTSRKKGIIIDLMLCWGYPTIIMILHYIVQGNRFVIWEDFGCRPTIFISVPAILVFYGPIAVVVILIFIYSTLAFAAFYRRRRTFTSFLKTTNSPFTTRRYLRLMAIITVLSLWDATVVGVVFAITFSGGLSPYTSWADVHLDFWRVDTIPTAFIPPDLLRWQYISWWTVPLSGFSFFCFFSFGEDAVAEYGPYVHGLARWVRRVCGRPPTSSETPLVVPRWTIDDDSNTIILDIEPRFSSKIKHQTRHSLDFIV
ncbi:fungal pheromone STE3G-protein-coupled receptor [Mycena crocata]|nr:fungal pheromone STE3G-protein-coupled receptor [Mycena crocata]